MPGLDRDSLQTRVEENPLGAQHSPRSITCRRNEKKRGKKLKKKKSNCIISTHALIHKHILEITDGEGRGEFLLLTIIPWMKMLDGGGGERHADNTPCLWFNQAAQLLPADSVRAALQPA